MTQSRVTVLQVTCLTPRIGYDQAGAVAKLAMKKGYSLKEAALEMGCVERSIFGVECNPLTAVGGLLAAS